MEMLSLIGQLLGVLALFGGALLEGLHLQSILVPTAALIVFGGTLAAVLVSFPARDVSRALGSVGKVFSPIEQEVQAVIDEIGKVAALARKEGILAVEQIRSEIQNPLLKRSIKFVIDGFDGVTLKEILENEIDQAFDEDETAGRVWEAAGGYAPTIGIIGAVLGLIHVMQSLDDPSKIGGGIAVAFVATVYGVAGANLVFLPWGSKLRRRAHLEATVKELVKIGVLGIQEGLNPHFLHQKLQVFLREGPSSESL